MHEQSEDNRDQWIFGLPILKEYNLILDNENKKVGLVHNNSWKKINQKVIYTKSYYIII